MGERNKFTTQKREKETKLFFLLKYTIFEAV